MKSRSKNSTIRWMRQYWFQMLTLAVTIILNLFYGFSVRKGMVSFVLILGCMAIFSVVGECCVKRFSASVFGEFSVVAGIIGAFLYSASFSTLSNKEKWYTILTADVIIALLIYEFVTLYLRKKRLEKCVCRRINQGRKNRRSRDDHKNSNFSRIKRIKRIIKDNFFFTVLLIVLASVYLSKCGRVPRWDSEWYFYDLIEACTNFDFKLRTFWNEFRLAKHLSLGYTSFLAIGTFITPGNTMGVQTVNLILYLFSLYFVYEIFLYTIPGLTRKAAAAGCLFVVCEPMVLGISKEINLDFGILIFSIYIFYMHIKQKRILFLFFSAVLVTTKETGVIVLIGYLIGYLFSRLLCCQGTVGQKIKASVKNPMFGNAIIFASVFFAGMIILIVTGNFGLWGGTSGNTSGSALSLVSGETDDLLNVFAVFNWNYVLLKMKTIFLMNFYWIISGMILIAAIFFMVKRIKFWKFLPEEYAGFYGAFGANLLFSFAYVTHNNPRYNLFSSFVLVFTGMILLFYLFGKAKRVIIFYCEILILFLIQSYTTVDPVTLTLFDTYVTNSEGTEIALPAWNGNWYLADTTAYNSQFNYLDKAFEGVLDECNYSGEDIILVGNLRGTYMAGRRFKYEWDPEKKTRVCIGNEKTIPISVIESEFEQKRQNGELSENAFYLVVPEFIGENEEHFLEYLSQFYEIGGKETVSVKNQGEISYYRMKLKNIQ